MAETLKLGKIDSRSNYESKSHPDLKQIGIYSRIHPPDDPVMEEIDPESDEQVNHTPGVNSNPAPMTSCIGACNVRGLNSPSRRKYTKDWIRSNEIDLMGLLETKIKERQQYLIDNFMGSNWSSANNYNSSPSGRIWVTWNCANIHLEIISQSPQALHCQVKFLNANRVVFISFIYASNESGLRRNLWSNLIGFGKNLNSPWLVIGDFHENKGGNMPKDTAKFYECIRRCNLMDMRNEAHLLTWSSKTKFSLDRAFVNPEWMQLFPSSVSFNLNHGLSDHSPIIIKNPTISNPSPEPFRFFNMWTSGPNFHDTISILGTATNRRNL